MKIADKDTAEQARALYDALLFLRGSALGEKLEAKLSKIDSDAITKAMHGKTPTDQNAYFEARGATKAVRDIRSLFEDIEADGKVAIDFMASFRAKGEDEG